MKYSTSILILLGLTSRYAYAYEECSHCKVILEEDGVKWGAENRDWCGKYYIK